MTSYEVRGLRDKASKVSSIFVITCRSILQHLADSAIFSKGNDGQHRMLYLAFKKLEACPTTRADMAELVLCIVLRDERRCIAATHDNSCALLGRLDVRVQ